MSLWWGDVVVGTQRGGDAGSATMLSSESSDGCSGWVVSEVVGSSLRLVHAWSLVIVVWSVMATIVVVVVLLPLMMHLFLVHLEPAELRSSMRLCLTILQCCGQSLHIPTGMKTRMHGHIRDK